MAIKVYKPTSAGRRISSVLDTSHLTKKEPEKNLIMRKKNSAGRNNAGRITVRHRGGGSRKLLRIVDSKREKFGVPAKVTALEYDPNRSASLMLLTYADGEKRYSIAPVGVKVGHTVVSAEKVDIRSGNRMKLANIPLGTMLHDIEMAPHRGGKMAKSAGSYATLQAVEGGYALLKVPSGEIRKVLAEGFASIGQVSNPDWNNVRWGKAGRIRLKGRRPQVLGKSMNPVDHPHGGGEGHSPIGRKSPVTPWGKPALGVKTRQKNKASNNLIVKRRSKRK
ncbi:MAG: 50S ribosomal protein L2 [Candidatus Doudnabacteria bacterium RIFCSPHIGHO2_02_FULL_46_11]|uniref:Large ribosomal subunit protein uL2 n=1 Tax=Candidatus Doudnabacteria bacterium RIFCSPHIGHO2_02_FULL_46_11 TaxID=1817832 RepID=A0A1F5P5F7_9BACT|nr:ribosomal protein L2 [uncultured bacterium]OGE85111.1 MAG: 50S ribosomal protein L2 [Candidatus Doudnabacteria bacterium RIFCSPHIGHO2_02_FULL_46_11]